MPSKPSRFIQCWCLEEFVKLLGACISSYKLSVYEILSRVVASKIVRKSNCQSFLKKAENQNPKTKPTSYLFF